MDLNWLQSILYGFISGLAEILPVSAKAHQTLLLKFFGLKGNMELMDLMIHLAQCGALYFCFREQLLRFSRARALAKVPKKKRRRPLDIRTLMDLRLLKTMLIPAILGLLLYRYTAEWSGNLMYVAGFLFLNGLLLYIPQFLPGSNRDSRTLSRVEGLLMGLGGGASILPGTSAVGVATSIGAVCGVERLYGLNLVLMMDMVLVGGFAVYDLLAVIGVGLSGLSFLVLLRCLITAATAFGATWLGVKLMQRIAANHGFSLFGMYCLGLSLFSFILNLLA